MNRKEYYEIYEELGELCDEKGWGDPFSYARGKELYMAARLGHTPWKNYSGPDAVNQEGELVEYKSTIQDSIKATYNGISVFDTWEKQEKYLVEDKIAKYAKHYFARFEGHKIVEIYVASGDDVLKTLKPKLQKQFNNPNRKSRKDPRLGATLTKKEILTISKKIL